ncbi:Aste57867_13678 [Aphanomyces stellatus]|uniref:Aste57867_13678 protein n=1 Tax=Aphanomyces stellatus TaxID=120398 RepID=A0A485KYR6_9STRA|nr:hypothetical protein As57867_013628 [Aphanomyces stellatus]VFT90511.1 Aste57867_13678 [Aphanomyces stellatus]
MRILPHDAPSSHAIPLPRREASSSNGSDRSLGAVGSHGLDVRDPNFDAQRVPNVCAPVGLERALVDRFTQYCWVDLDHAFEVAHTTARQQRCVDRYAHDGAVYMETVLLNQVWDDYLATYGGDGGMCRRG